MSIQRGIATVCLGHPTVHDIIPRLNAAAKYDFKVIELLVDDIEEHARKQFGDTSDANCLKAAQIIKDECDKLGQKVVVLQAFRWYEGLIDRKEHAAKIEKLKLWMKFVKILECGIVQIPSQFNADTTTTGDMNVIVADLTEAAELGAQQDPVVSIAFEAVAWGTHIDLWEQSWDVVKKVNKPNFGLCLDTFHIAELIWADPTSPTGRREDGDKNMKESIEKMIKELDPEKIFYFQVGDAERLAQPLVEGHPFKNPEWPARMCVSRNARLFMFEEDQGAYLPVAPIVEAIIKKVGFRGWVTHELFCKKIHDPDPQTIENFAKRADISWKKMEEFLAL